jgi:hypothetical protein
VRRDYLPLHPSSLISHLFLPTGGSAHPAVPPVYSSHTSYLSYLPVGPALSIAFQGESSEASATETWRASRHLPPSPLAPPTPVPSIIPNSAFDIRHSAFRSRPAFICVICGPIRRLFFRVPPFHFRPGLCPRSLFTFHVLRITHFALRSMPLATSHLALLKIFLFSLDFYPQIWYNTKNRMEDAN